MALNPCTCGSTDIFYVQGCSTVYIECAECKRRTPPFIIEENAELAWNTNNVLKEK